MPCVSAFSLANGTRLWRTDSKPKDADSTNVGGGLGVDESTLYAVNGLSQLVALDVANGKTKWRRDIGVPGRSAPTIADGTGVPDHDRRPPARLCRRRRSTSLVPQGGRTNHLAARPPGAGILPRPRGSRLWVRRARRPRALTAAPCCGPTASAQPAVLPASRIFCRSVACRSSTTGRS